MGTRPDYAVTVRSALTGFIELKAPGKGTDPRKFTDPHDKRQWQKLKSLPNLLYSDGQSFSLWQNGALGDLAAAMTMVPTAVASGLITSGRNAALRLVLRFVTILDAEHCLVLAGDVQAGSIRWCAPVDSDAEGRRVVGEACGLRAEARAATDTGNPAAVALLTRARALEGRLVDPFWRDLAAIAVDHAQAA